MRDPFKNGGVIMALIDAGKFTSAGVAKKINLPGDADFMRVINSTQLATTKNPGRGVVFEWQKGLADGYGWMYTKQTSLNALDLEQITSGGFTRVSSAPAPEAQVTGTALTAATPAVATATSHGYSVGDRLRVYGTTGMLQIGGMEFTVTAVGGANNYTLGYLPAVGFAAPATAILSRRLPSTDLVEPGFRYITNISQAAQAVVTLSVTHTYQIGELLFFRFPNQFGMQEIDGKTARVVAISTANNTVTIDLDTTGYTAFAFPASADGPFRFPICCNAGQQGFLNPNYPPAPQYYGYDASLAFHSGQFYPYMLLGAGVDSPAGSTSDVIYWQAYKADQYQS